MIQDAVDGAMAQRKPLKKVQSKHLNENNLRNMIKESVRRALNESNIDVLNVNKYGSYELASSTDPADEEKKIELLDEFGRAFEEVVQMYMANLAGMFKRTNKQAYDKIMKLRNDLIKAGAFNITPENLGLKPYHMDDDSEYYSDMYDN